MSTAQAQALRANISAPEAQEQVTILREAIDDFMNGGSGGPGLVTSLRDLQSSRRVIEDAIGQLETAGGAADIAGTIGNLASVLATSLEIVSKLAGPFGPAFKVATDIIGAGLIAIEEGAANVEEQFNRVTDFVDDVSPVLEDLVTLFADGLEPTIESYIAEISRLGTTVDILHEALPVIDLSVGIVGAEPGPAQSEVPLRLIQAVADIQAYALAQATVVDTANNADDLPTDAFLEVLNGPEGALIATLGKIDGALDVLDGVDRVFGPLEQPLEIAAIVLEPIQFLLDLSGFFVDLVIAPVISRLVKAFGIDKIFDPIVDQIADLIPEIFGADSLRGDIQELVTTTVFEALAGIDTAGELGLDANVLGDLGPDDRSDASFDVAGAQLASLTAQGIAGDVRARLIEALSDSTLPRDIVDEVLQAVNDFDLSTLPDLTFADATVQLSDGRVLLADPTQADGNGIVTLEGGEDDDTLVDNGGSSLLLGREGSDVILVSGGNDTIDGGSSTTDGAEDEDFAVFTDFISNFRFTYEEDTDGTDTLVVRHFTPGSTRGYVGENEIANIEQIKFANAQTSIDQLDDLQEAAPGAAFEGSDGADFVIVGPDGPADSIETFGGNDFIVADGTRIVDAGEGDDFVVIDGSETSVDGGAGADVLSLGSAPVGLKIDLSAPANDETAVTYFEGTQELTYVGADANGDPLAVDSSQPARSISNFEYVLGSGNNDTIIGGDETNAFDGNSGDDSLDGGGGADTLNGSGGDDTLRGGEGADVMIGGTGDDRFIGFEAGDDIDGGAGRDLVQVDNRTRDLSFEFDFVGTPEDQAVKITNVEELELGTGQDTVTVGDQLEVLRTRGGADRVTVVEGANLTMTTASGNDTVDSAVAVNLDVNLSSGNDRLTLSGQVGAVEGAEIRADGGGGTDAITFDQDATDEAGAVTLTGNADGVLRGRLEDVEGGITALEIENFEAFAFTSGDISLTSGASAIRTVLTGTGDDLIDLSDSTTTGAIRIATEGGDNELVTKSNVDSTLIAGDGNDILRVERVDGSAGSHDLDGGAGDDVFALSRGLVTIEGGDGFDTIDFGGLAAAVTVDLTEKEGSIPGFPFVTFDGIEAVTGSRFNDSVDGNDADNRIVGGAGNDSVTGGGGDDTIEGGDGNDFLRGRGDDDLIFGGNGNDGLRGDDGNDELHVGTGRDRAFGGNGDDLLVTTIESRVSNGAPDTLSGGNGIDTAVFEAAATSLGGVFADLDTGNVAHLDGGPAFATLDGVENLVGSDFDDRLQGDGTANAITGNGGNDTILGGEGNDTLQGGSGFDSIDGQGGNDVILIGESNGTVSGGDGQDTAVLQLIPSVTVTQDDSGAFVAEQASSVARIVEQDGALLVQHATVDASGAVTVLGLAQLDATVETLQIVEVPETEDAAPVIQTIDVATALASGAFDTGETLAAAVFDTEDPFIPRLGLDAQGNEEFESVRLNDGTVVSFFEERDDSRVITDRGIATFDEAGNRTVVELDIRLNLGSGASERVKPLDGGGFVVSGLSAFQVFDETGNAVTGPREFQSFNDMIPLESGGFFGLFSGFPDSRETVFAQEFDENGNRVGGSQRVSQLGRTDVDPSGAQLTDGGIVVAWQETTGDDDVLFTIINQSGSVRKGPTDVIGSSSGSRNETPEVLALEDGTFLIFYVDRNNREIVQKHYNSSGNEISEVAIVEDLTINDARDIAAALGPNGEIILSFDDNRAGIRSLEYRVENPLLDSNTQIRAGNAFDERIIGDDSNEDFRGFAGDDTILAGNGQDTVRAGEGDDTVNAGGGNDGVLGGSGNDSVNGNVGNDTIDGGHGDDVLSGGSGNDIVRGGTGNDTVLGFNDNDTLFGDDGDDEVNGEGGNDSIEGGKGDDFLRGGSGNDTLDGGTGDDRLLGDTGSDLVRGGDGADSIDGFDGNDTLLGGDGDDTIRGANGNDSIDGGNGDDTITGNDGNDLLRGGTGNDQVDGGGGGDTLFGGSGNDTFRGGSGNDFFAAQGGTDIAVFAGSLSDYTVERAGPNVAITDLNASRDGNDGVDQIRDVELLRFEADGGPDVTLSFLEAGEPVIGAETLGIVFGSDGDDIVRARGGDDTVTGEAGDDRLFGGTGNDVLKGGEGNDILKGGTGNDILAGGAGDDQINAGTGNDQISGGDGNDTVNGGVGDDNIGGGTDDDVIEGNAGDDTIGAGQGNDTAAGNDGNDIVNGGAGNDSLSGGEGNDTMGAGFNNDTVEGNAGDDSLGGGTGRDILSGGEGNDVIGAGAGDDIASGGNGNDRVNGGGRNDELNGNSGDDTINGGDGDDTMTGGDGVDVFVFNVFEDGDADVITDFEDGIDTFRMTGVENAPGTGNAGRVDALMITDVEGGAQVNYQGHTILVEGILAAQLTTDDFLFL